MGRAETSFSFARMAVQEVVAALKEDVQETMRDADDLQVPSGRALTLGETLALIAPREGPRDPLPAAVEVLVVGAGRLA